MKNFLKNLFHVDFESNAASAWIAIISGILAVIITSIIAIPQIIYIAKTKKTDENTSYASFWVFFTSLILWIILGGFGSFEPKFVASVFANIISSLFYVALMFMLYRYSTNEKKRNKQYIVLSVSAVIAIAASVAGLIGLFYGEHIAQTWKLDESDKSGETKKLVKKTVEGLAMPPTLFTFLLLVVPLMTTFAFAPQMLSDFKNKNFDTLSIGQVVTLILTNVVWIAYWIAISFQVDPEVNKKGYDFSNQIGPLTTQTISLLIYVLQFAFTLKYKNSKNKEENLSEPTLEKIQTMNS